MRQLPSPDGFPHGKRQSLRDWMAQCVEDEKTKEDALTSFGVYHLILKGTVEVPDEIDRVAIDSGITLADLAKRFTARISERVAECDGAQKIEIYAFYGDSSEPGAKRMFKAHPNPSLVGGTGDSTPATQNGFIAQLMQHTREEAALRLATQEAQTNAWLKLNEVRDRQFAEIVKENIDLRREVSDGYVIIRDMTLAVRTDDTQHQILLDKQAKSTAMQMKLLQWAPSLVNTILGRKVFSEAAEDTAIIEGLLGEMGPDAVQMFLGMIPETIRGPVAARANQIFQKRDAAAAARAEARQIARGTGNLLEEMGPEEPGESGTAGPGLVLDGELQ